MQELRLVAVSEDGSYAVMIAPGRSGRFALPIDERLRTIARGQFSRLAQYEIEVESPLRPKEIQERIRAGETAEDIADAAGLPIDKVRRFEGPVLAEREFQAQQAQRATVRGHSDPGPGPRLGDIVADRLTRIGATPLEAEWDTRKRADGNWQLHATFIAGGREYAAEWVYDARGKHVTPANDEAARLCLPETDWPGAAAGAATGAATVTPIAPRLTAAGQQEPDRLAAHGAAPSRPSRRPVQPAAGLGQPALQYGHGQQHGHAPAPARQDEIATDAGALTAAGSQHGWAAAEQASLAEPAVEAPAAAAAAAEPGRRARRVAGGRRRSSVPSWDEIILGNSRPAD